MKAVYVQVCIRIDFIEKKWDCPGSGHYVPGQWVQICSWKDLSPFCRELNTPSCQEQMHRQSTKRPQPVSVLGLHNHYSSLPSMYVLGLCVVTHVRASYAPASSHQIPVTLQLVSASALHNRTIKMCFPWDSSLECYLLLPARLKIQNRKKNFFISVVQPMF